MSVATGPWGLTSAVPASAGEAEVVSGRVLEQIAAALAHVWGEPLGPLGLAHDCPGCGSTVHGAPTLVGLPPGRTALVSFTHVALPDRRGHLRRHRVGAWHIPSLHDAPDGHQDARRLIQPGLGLDMVRVDEQAFADESGLGSVAYSAAEKGWIRTFDELEQGFARAKLWARKEALVKAAGSGFMGDPALVAALEQADDVRVVDLTPPTMMPGVVGSIAFSGRSTE